jgi:hypothetical protein
MTGRNHEHSGKLGAGVSGIGIGDRRFSFSITFDNDFSPVFAEVITHRMTDHGDGRFFGGRPQGVVLYLAVFVNMVGRLDRPNHLLDVGDFLN